MRAGLVALLGVVAFCAGCSGERYPPAVPLCRALAEGRVSEASRHVEGGVDVNRATEGCGTFVDWDGASAFCVGLARLDADPATATQAVDSMFRRGADVSLPCAFSRDQGHRRHLSGTNGYPIDLAAERASPAMARVLLDHGLQPREPRVGAAMMRLVGRECDGPCVELLDVLLGAGADVAYREGRNTLLSAAIASNSRAAVALLEKHGAREW